MRYTTPRDRIHVLCDQLAEELIAFWSEDGPDVLTLPAEALRQLAADYLRQRNVYKLASRCRSSSRRQQAR